ncbi:uncharacterized, partial [Tachysurus ichikawai]
MTSKAINMAPSFHYHRLAFMGKCFAGSRIYPEVKMETESRNAD